MASKALHSDQKVADPTLYRLLQMKEKFRHRYVEWWDLEQDSQAFTKAKEGYFALIAAIDPKVGEGLKLQGHTPWMQLKKLDDTLRRLLPRLDRKQLEALEKQHQNLFPSEKTPIMVLKYRHSLDLVMQAILETHQKVKTVSSQLLHEKGKEILPEPIYKVVSHWLQTDKMDPKEFKKLLYLYVKQEEPVDIAPVMIEFLDKKIVDIPVIAEAFTALLQEKQQGKVLQLVDLMSELNADPFFTLLKGEKGSNIENRKTLQSALSIAKKLYDSTKFKEILATAERSVPKDELILALEKVDRTQALALFQNDLNEEECVKIINESAYQSDYLRAVVSSSRQDRVNILSRTVQTTLNKPDLRYRFHKTVESALLSMIDKQEFSSFSAYVLELYQEKVISIFQLHEICSNQILKGKYADLLPLLQEIGKNLRELPILHQFTYAVLNLDFERIQQLERDPKVKYKEIIPYTLKAARALRTNTEYDQIVNRLSEIPACKPYLILLR